VSVDPGSQADGRDVAAAASLAHTHLVALVRGDRVLMPGDGVRIQGGDRVLVFNTRRGVADVKRAFTAA
jgi:Trk K+ transport system NAD-binding subunit